MAWPQASITLGDLVTSYELGLVLIAGPSDTGMAPHSPVFEAPVQWVHTSDLADPTPFLVPRMVLLTTGGQFAQTLDEVTADTYVTRLVDAGVTALGFGVGLAHDRTPHTLISACERAGLPLFRVPYETPFLAIAQSAARMLATITYERELRSLETQRAISRAALRPRGIGAAVETLSSRLDRWVGLYTASGTITHLSPQHATPIAQAAWVKQAVRDLAGRGTRANVSRRHGDTRVHLQTILNDPRVGPGRVHSVLVIEHTSPLDHADHASVELVATLASIDVAQHGSLSAGQEALRAAVFTLLIVGEYQLAQLISNEAGWSIPKENLVMLALGSETEIAPETVSALQATVSQMERCLLAIHEGGVALAVAPTALRRVTDVIAGLGLRAGVSTKHPTEGASEALAEAETALHDTTTPERQIVTFSPRMGEGIFPLLSDDRDALTRATQLLTPITDYDERNDETLRDTLRLWLGHHGQNSPTAQALGLHRHTVASRMKLVASLLQRDLADPGVRANLWFALELTKPQGSPSRAV